MTTRDDLIACYRSEQMSEAQWRQHLNDDPGLAAAYEKALEGRSNG